MEKIAGVILAVTGAALIFYLAILDKTAETDKADVHYAPTPQPVVDDMLGLAEVGPQDVLYDLGCGDGRIVITAAKRWGTRGVGIDIDPKLIRLSKRNAARARVEELTNFYVADLFQTDFSEATVVTLYLLPELNLRLRPKLLRELRPGSRVVSHSWEMGEWQSDASLLSKSYWNEWVPGDTPKRSRLFLWIVPAGIDGLWHWRDGRNDSFQELRITQHFQKGKAAFSEPSGETPALVEIKGEQIRITTKEKGEGRSQTLTFEGLVRGDVIEGTAVFINGSRAENHFWQATRPSSALMPWVEESR